MLRYCMLFVGLLSSLTSCVDVIQLDLNRTNPAVVIEGRITDQDSMNEVRITQSVDFDHANEFPPITNAQVAVRDLTTGQTDSLHQSFPGVYPITKLTGVPGHRYQLTVTIGEKSYSALATMPPRVELDQVSYTTDNRLNGTSIRTVATYTDPAAPGNYYRFVNYQNGLASRTFFVRSDAFINGNRVVQTIRDDNITIQPGDTMAVDMQCIEKAVFEYFNGLAQLQGDNINQGVSPTNPPGNLSGGALGYFSAHTVARRTVVIP
ncbi:DUF4249 domain-containing protein [Fibrisoma montanum]|uniref:DUF4249 domain-containing protein n=2 Tax=Fibrisoma montanum TaxID=2305895 RepID=A0A418MC46_9BACT|nr:DUF4249 domain-containing protein [Fibrisoma montanum]